MQDEHDQQEHEVREAESEKLLVFRSRAAKPRPVLLRLTQEDLARINELVAQHGLG